MLLSIFLTLVQDPTPPVDPIVDDPVIVPVPILDLGGLQAPAGPRGRSRASIGRLPRTTLVSPKGNYGRIEARVTSLVGVRGREENVIEGLGLVIGLNGTGDSGQLATVMLRNFLLTHNLNVPEGALKPDNLAVVLVEATLPAGMKPGQRIDARVSSFGDAESLSHGTLVSTEMFDMGGERVYATVSGPVTVGGYTVTGDAATATKNHPTVGTLPQGAVIQREVPTSVVSENGYIYLDSKSNSDSFGNMVRIAEAINRLYPGAAQVLPDGRTVRVGVPRDLPESQYVAYLDTLLQLEVETDNLSRVVINDRTGTIVMGGDVRLRPGVITHGSLFVTVAETEQVSQPAGFS
ncbi:MAG: flagellar basal body P-ring protein FlgI, partial [Planctomycetota bacterium]|nr:flagellar basal body P-ring protein FlgI [Planctomycetota bacterium]